MGGNVKVYNFREISHIEKVESYAKTGITFDNFVKLSDFEQIEQKVKTLADMNCILVNHNAHLSEKLTAAENRVKGMILSLQKHGQNIDVKFHIDWLNEAVKWN
jgi:predicted TIM-barrel fold metal-dependent hydrolase